MKLKKSSLVWTFIWCLFMGVTAISIGFGALFPPLNYVAAPFVCPGGTMSAEQQVYRPSPGTTVTTITWYCTNRETGESNELSMWPMSVASGLIYGLLLFLGVLLGMQILARRSARRSAARYAVEDSRARFAKTCLLQLHKQSSFKKQATGRIIHRSGEN
jgi:hypothetical protein